MTQIGKTKMPLKKIVLDLETQAAFVKASADLSENQKNDENGDFICLNADNKSFC